MKKLSSYRELAEQLRRQGKTYNEILMEVPVAKSSLSLWLSKMPLTEKEKWFVRKKVTKNISRGRIAAGLANHERRLVRDKEIKSNALKAFLLYQNDPLFYSGLALYWAEGSKRTHAFQFVNSDVRMIQMMIWWLEKYVLVKKDDLRFRLYIHKTYAHENCEEWWRERLNVALVQFRTTIYKPTHRLVKKRQNYKGCLRIEVKGVVHFRTVLAWIAELKRLHLK